MDAVLFGRLRNYIVTTIGSEFQQDLSKLTVCIVEFVEKTGADLALASNEKLTMCLDWLQKILAEVGITLTTGEISMITSFISRICEAAKGLFQINIAPVVTSTITNAAPVVPMVTITSSTTSSTTGSSTSGSKKGGFFKKSRDPSSGQSGAS